MFPKLIDLRPDRNLLLEDFDGYKLSLEPTPLLKHELVIKPDKVRTNKYSFLHAQLFGLQNHLVRDNFSPNSAYFIDESFMVKKVQYDETMGKMKPLSNVFKTTTSRPRTGDYYNFSFVFLSEFMVVMSDGVGCLKLIETGDRTKNAEWKCILSINPLNEGKPETGFLIQDARFEIDNEERQIHCILVEIEEVNDSNICKLHWLKLVKKANSQWSLAFRKELTGKHIPSYCFLETKSKGLVIAGDAPFKFIGDLESTSVSAETAIVPEAVASSESNKQINWLQTDEDVSVIFPEIDACVKDDFSVVSTQEELTVTYRGTGLFEKRLSKKIDPALTTWTLQNNALQVILMKAEVDSWEELYVGGPIEENQEIIEEPVKILEAELEECDFGLAGMEADYNIERFDLESHKVTHRISLGSVAPLFHVSLRPTCPPALALRFDQDCCVWLQTNSNNVKDSSNWNLRHTGSILAFAYIQASKQQKKFITCSPDMDYGIICESERHVFVYKNSDSWTSGLKNRKGRQVQIGQQKLIQLDQTGEVLGISAENEVTMLLTEKFVICMQLQVKD